MNESTLYDSVVYFPHSPKPAAPTSIEFVLPIGLNSSALQTLITLQRKGPQLGDFVRG